jgi:hypothetical protein
MGPRLAFRTATQGLIRRSRYGRKPASVHVGLRSVTAIAEKTWKSFWAGELSRNSLATTPAFDESKTIFVVVNPMGEVRRIEQNVLDAAE